MIDSPSNKRWNWRFGLLRGGGWLAWIAGGLTFALAIAELCLGDTHPLIGIYAYLVVPLFVVLGLLIRGVGWACIRRHGEPARLLPVMAGLTAGTAVFYSLSLVSLAGLTSVRGFHYTESVNFCGKACHSSMHPELEAFSRSAHAHLACADCHVGPGVKWFFISRMLGLRMAYHHVLGNYERPIQSPHGTRRSPDETCGVCHVAQRERPDLRRTRNYALSNAGDAPWIVDLLVKVGGAERGAHWHAAPEHRVEYIATDDTRNLIPWVSLTDASGQRKVFRTTVTNELLSADQVTAARPITMDCLDCHNRAGHEFASPDRAINAAFAAGRLAGGLPGLKMLACNLLTNAYASVAEADASIAQGLRATYADAGTNLDATVADVQRVYHENFFPDLKADWRAHPDHLGHFTSPGCFRCHDGKHASDDGQIIRHNCDLCHAIVAQGPAAQPTLLASGTSLKFDHPEDLGNLPTRDRCTRCHKGVPIP